MIEYGWFVPEELRSGDIFETPSKVPPHSPVFAGLKVGAVKHVGMICIIDGKKYVAHSPFGGYPCIEPYENVFKDRGIERIIRTNTSTDQILKRIEQIKSKKYNFYYFNCEDTVRYLCGCSLKRIDQRMGYTVVLLIFVILILLLLLVKK